MNVQEQIALGHELIGTMPGVLDHCLIGSATYLPAPADIDFAVMLSANEDAMEYAKSLRAIGWKDCGDYDAEDNLWCAVRRGHINLMLTHNKPFYDRYKTAMEVCRALRLQHKEDRIAVCRIVRDGWTADMVTTTAIAAEQSKTWGVSATLPDPAPYPVPLSAQDVVTFLRLPVAPPLQQVFGRAKRPGDDRED